MNPESFVILFNLLIRKLLKYISFKFSVNRWATPDNKCLIIDDGDQLSHYGAHSSIIEMERRLIKHILYFFFNNLFIKKNDIIFLLLFQLTSSPSTSLDKWCILVSCKVKY